MTKNSVLAEITSNNVIHILCGNWLQMHNIKTLQNPLFIHFLYSQTTINAFIYICNHLF